MEDHSGLKKEVILRHIHHDTPIQASNVTAFTPQYLNLHEQQKTTTKRACHKLTSPPELSSPSNGGDCSVPGPSTCFVDVCFVSSDGDIFLCNKLYMARLVLNMLIQLQNKSIVFHTTIF